MQTTAARETLHRVATDYRQGDYRVVAQRLLPASEELAAWAAPAPAELVVDLAAGSGNLARVCRARGCDVVAVDRVREQLLLGIADGRDGIGWVTGDALALPLRDGAADAALSVFGMVYAEQPGIAVAEMARVCRPGGILGLTAWPADGYQLALAEVLREALALQVRHDFLTVWGTADAIAEQLTPVADDVEVRTANLIDRFASVGDWWRTKLASPVIADARSALDDGAFDELGRRLRELAHEYGRQDDDGFVMHDRYLLARGRVR